ncbi:hypothetical protein Tco_0702068 [Tanacetum coccineum]|uniref:Uncharacterized protein n=1 Tax=Tanacetum coccineum TaxID=301880 RepID=A0ABQ4XVQ3_9ASTR
MTTSRPSDSAAVQNQADSSARLFQETQLHMLFKYLTLQDPANSNGQGYRPSLVCFVKDFWTRQIPPQIGQHGDLISQSRLHRNPQAFLVGQQTLAPRLGHPGSEELRFLDS